MPAPTWPNLSSALPIRPRNSETRQDIAGRYDQIVADQRQAIATAQKTAAAAEIDRDAHAAKATELNGQLEQMKTEDDATELRLKAALDAVEAREASSRETGNRLVRRLEDSKRIRDKVKAERDAGIAAAQQTVDATRAQLETLRHEYAELQRNPSANPANYTVRTSELSMQISASALRDIWLMGRAGPSRCKVRVRQERAHASMDSTKSISSWRE